MIQEFLLLPSDQAQQRSREGMAARRSGKIGPHQYLCVCVCVHAVCVCVCFVCLCVFVVCFQLTSQSSAGLGVGCSARRPPEKCHNLNLSANKQNRGKSSNSITQDERGLLHREAASSHPFPSLNRGAAVAVATCWPSGDHSSCVVSLAYK